MIQILNIESLQVELNELYCVAYSREVADIIHYTNFDRGEVLHYIQKSRNVVGVKVIEEDKHPEHIINYLERNIEMLISEMINKSDSAGIVGNQTEQ